MRTTAEGVSYNSKKQRTVQARVLKASVGNLNGSYGLVSATVEIRSNKSKGIKKITYHSNDLFYDYASKKVYLHEIAELPKTDGYYDLVTEQLKSMFAK